MKFKFTKMQGLGNDFLVLDATAERIQLSVAQIRFLADRHLGVGADQILVLELPRAPNETQFNGDIDFIYRVYNADGSRAYQCGNGVRCLAKYIYNHGLAPQKRQLVFSTGAKSTRVWFDEDGEISVAMGEPIFLPSQIPFVTNVTADVYSLDYAVKNLPTQKITFGVVSMGNPHAVIDVATLRVKEITAADVCGIGAFLAAHSSFPESVNVNFMQIITPNRIKLCTYERGSGVTLACGSGACAAVAVGQIWGLLAETVVVEMTGGNLSISWAGSGYDLFMKGAAAEVFVGEIEA